MEKLKKEDITLHIRMKLIGYYRSEDQFMRTEKIFPEEAEELAMLLHKSFATIPNNKLIDDEMKQVFNDNTVFILKGEDGRLYGYYPRYNVARITAVHYVKGKVIPMPDNYKRWFYPGEVLRIYKPISENDIMINKSE